MYPKRMMHAAHGWHYVVNALEEAALRAIGWVDDDGLALKQKLAATSAVDATVDAIATVLDAMAPKRRGRPPKVHDGNS